MIREIVAFLALLGLGAACRPLFVLLTAAERKINLIGVTAVFDFIAVALAMSAFAAAVFFLSDGNLSFYHPFAAILGYCAVAAFF